MALFDVPPLWIPSLSLDTCKTRPWYLVLAMRRLELRLPRSAKKALSRTRRIREQIVGSLLWTIWRHRMADMFDKDFSWTQAALLTSLDDALSSIDTRV